MNKISLELQKQLCCKLDITYGNDMVDKECKDTLNHLEKVCKENNLKFIATKQKRYCYNDYREISIKATLPLFDVFNLIKLMKLDVDVYIEKNGSIVASYDNTYY